MGKRLGLRTAKFNCDNLIISVDPQDDPINHMHWGKRALLLMFLNIETHDEFGIQLQHTLRLDCTWKITSGQLNTLGQHSRGNKNMCPIVPVCGLPIAWYLRTVKFHLLNAI